MGIKRKNWEGAHLIFFRQFTQEEKLQQKILQQRVYVQGYIIVFVT